MIKLHTSIALCAALILGACASPTPAPAGTGEHAGHGAAAGASAPMEPRMQAMHEMHQKMMNAKTPEERNALMADHMKAMNDGMGMMKGMHEMGGMGAMHDAKGGPADMAQHHKSMEHRMEMMEMMMDRLPSAPPKP
jgi:hypothetical protein